MHKHKKTRNRLTGIENIPVVTRGEEVGGMGKIGEEVLRRTNFQLQNKSWGCNIQHRGYTQ